MKTPRAIRPCYLLAFLTIGLSGAMGGQAADAPKPSPQDQTLGLVQSRLPRDATFSAEAFYTAVGARLRRDFNARLADPARYEATVAKECRVFPEGTLYPYVLPALGYANVAFRDPRQKENSRTQMAKLLDMAVPRVAKEVQPPGGDLLNLRTYQNHGTYLGTLSFALGAYELATGDNRYSRLHDRLSGVLFGAMLAGEGKPIRSYPLESWNFDTIIVLASLHVHDLNRGTRRNPALVERHLRWVQEHGLHAETGLPYSMGWDASDEKRWPPRGCDISMRLCLLAHFAPDEAGKLYRKYTAAHWVELGPIGGFAEWPRGSRDHAPDVDSGPVFMGIGLTATGMGVGTVRAMRDQARQLTLASELAVVESIVKLAASGNLQGSESALQWFQRRDIVIDPLYFTGFLYGDAALFYAVTWTKLPEKANARVQAAK